MTIENMKAWLLEKAGDEPIIGVVLGAGEEWTTEGVPYHLKYLSDLPEGAADRANFNRVLTWDEAAPLLDYSFDDGYGGYEGHAICAWTPTRVLFMDVYDGAQALCAVPRNPTDHSPIIPGGG